MKRSPHTPLLLLLLCAAVLLPRHGDAQNKRANAMVVETVPPRVSTEAAATLVVFNAKDRDSGELARFYAARRGIPKEQVIGLQCSQNEEITRAEYDRDIAEPLRAAFEKNGWWKLSQGPEGAQQVDANRIRFVALMRGVPLKIAPAPGYPGDKPGGGPVASRNEASTDSEIAVLGLFSKTVSGAFNNPYYRSFARIADAAQPSLMLVCRLDAATAETVKRMIVDALAIEQEGLRGFAYVDARGIKDAGLAEGDKWLTNLATDARQRGTPVILDNGEGMFPISYPMRHAALYFGWYSENVAGPMARPDFRFKRGAVVAHIHSFSAATLRDPRRYWAAPLLAAGAAATVGNVYEPYLALTPNLDVMHERLRTGLTFAESAWSAQRVTSWTTTFLGDPLYRPFAADAELKEQATASEWDAYAAGAKKWQDDQAQGAEQLRESAKKLRSGVIMEGLGLLQLADTQIEPALESFRAAREFYRNPEDILRATIHEVLRLRAMNKVSEALALTRKQLAAHGSSPAGELLRSLEAEMAPPAPKPGGTAPSGKAETR